MYYGKSPQFEQYLTDSFTSDAVTYAAGYPLSYNPGLAQAIDVSVGGAVQRPNLDFTLVGQTLVFSPELPDGLTVFVKYLGVSGSSVSIPDASVTPVKMVETLLTKSVTGGANVTLTANEAANSAYEFVGVLSANINVIVPSVIRTMPVRNLTTGSYSLTIKTSAGLGVTIPQGTSNSLYCNGIDVVSAGSSGGATGGATGGGNDRVFYENDKIVTDNYTITTGKNAMSAGPIEVAAGAIVTVSAGSVWTIV